MSFTGPRIISGRRSLWVAELTGVTADEAQGFVAGVLDFTRPASIVLYPLILGV